MSLYMLPIHSTRLPCILRDLLKDSPNLPNMVNNFLMRYPDSFGQRIKKLRLDLISILFKAQVNQVRDSRDIGT